MSLEEDEVLLDLVLELLDELEDPDMVDLVEEEQTLAVTNHNMCVHTICFANGDF